MSWNSYSWYVIMLHTNYLEIIILLQVAYQRILQLTYVEELLNALKALFTKLFEPFLTTFVTSLRTIGNAAASAPALRDIQDWNFAKAFGEWDNIFDKLLRGIQDKVAQACKYRDISLTVLIIATGEEVTVSKCACAK